jgi:hypothetical protein
MKGNIDEKAYTLPYLKRSACLHFVQNCGHKMLVRIPDIVRFISFERDMPVELNSTVVEKKGFLPMFSEMKAVHNKTNEDFTECSGVLVRPADSLQLP